MSSPNPTIAFFGATGGVTNGVLVNALRSGANVVALVRTPSKLTKQLEAQNISPSILSSQLTIISGNALDVSSVKSTLTANKPNYLVKHIVTGLGATPGLQFNWRNPFDFIAMDQPTICEDAAKTLIKALKEIYSETPGLAERRPKATYVSTTGISDGPEDVPWGMQTLYHSILHIPHMDKRAMEKTFRDNMAGKDGETCFSGVVGIRPTLLTGSINADEGIGSDKIRVGPQAEPALGWTICRADVGHWMWLNVVGDDEKRKVWENDNVTMTN